MCAISLQYQQHLTFHGASVFLSCDVFLFAQGSCEYLLSIGEIYDTVKYMGLYPSGHLS